MKMYDPNEDDHSYMDMEMLPNMYLNQRKEKNDFNISIKINTSYLSVV